MIQRKETDRERKEKKKKENEFVVGRTGMKRLFSGVRIGLNMGRLDNECLIKVATPITE